MRRRKKYVQVGVGGRSWPYTAALGKTMRAECELVGLCDNNRGRLDLRNRRIVAELKSRPVPVYLDTQFDSMIREQKPDVAVITSKDSTHDQYIVRAMNLGCDVVCEKPMTIDEKKCRRIVKAVKQTGRRLMITFNCRYMPPMMRVKELLMSGVIGRILSVDLRWMLDVNHGASYFRRWHAEKKSSGGLLLHKASHHFDLVNWFLSANPVEVFAMGARSFYGDQSGTAERLGLKGHAQRCLECRHQKKCPFFFDLKGSEDAKAMYLACEKYDRYVRDRCVFGKGIDIEDTMNLAVRYDSGAFLSYSLNAFTPWEGFHFAFNGTKGRLEFDNIGFPIRGGKKLPDSVKAGEHIRLYPHFKPAMNIPTKFGKGSHGGGDDALMKDLFSAQPAGDKLMRAADYASGAMSILIGAAANISMRTDKPVRIDLLVKGLPKPKLPPMPE
ncbi:MAG: Gfo/Idh/MocA family oxidoreductase [Kiritimatiellae bacterium]|nr:Gfo/Idh/MocA family oxidoreductase [Kiritimatiellia bacterium]